VPDMPMPAGQCQCLVAVSMPSFVRCAFREVRCWSCC
jgi:hypothetical protein